MILNFGSRKRLCAVLLCLITSEAALAGIPYLTDDPVPVDLGHFELDISSQQVDTKNSRSGSLPYVELDYGAAPNLQLHVLTPLAFNQSSSQGFQYGLGDIEFGAKYRLLQESDTLPMMSIYPDLITSIGDSNKGLGNGAIQLEFPIWFQKNWGSWQSNAGAAYWINRASNAENHWFFGWQLQYNVSDQLTLGGELYYLTELQHQQGAEAGFNLGSIYNFDSHNHLLFSIGRGLSYIKSTNELSTYIGYQRAW